MLPTFIRFLGLGEKPPQAEAVPGSSQLSDHMKDFPVEPWKRIENTALAIPSATCEESLDGSSDEYEDESYAFPAEVIDCKDKKHSIMALHNPSSRENHISKMFADDLGLPIPEPPHVPSVQVSWSSSSLQRYNETTMFTVAGPASFKLLFGREDEASQHGASSKHHSLGGKNKVGRSRPIRFKEGIRKGLLYKVELDDSDSLEAGNVQQGPKLADVEARLQSDHSVSLSPLEKYVKEYGNVETTIGNTMFSADDDLISARKDRSRGPEAENWTHTSPRKPMISTSSTNTPVVAACTNPFAVLALPNASPSKKKKRKSSSKKSIQNSEREVVTQRPVPDHNLPATDMENISPSSYTPRYCDPVPSLSLSSSQHLDPVNSHEASSESGHSNINYTTKVARSNLSAAPEEHSIPPYSTSPLSYDGKKYNGSGKERIPRSSKTFQSKFEKIHESTLQREMPESSTWVEGLEVAPVAQDTQGASYENNKRVDHFLGRQKRKTGNKKRK